MANYPKEYFDEEDNLESNPWSCFVLMPFGGPYDEFYNEIIKETLEENNYTVKRADEIYGSKPIMEDILNGINDSELILADLTDKNPNVFYELGIAHTVKPNNNVLLISQSIDFVPFDIRPYRVIIYEPTITGAKILSKQLHETLKEFRTIPIEIFGHKWKPQSPTWLKTDINVLRGEINESGEIPLIFNKSPFRKEKLTIEFNVNSQDSEINVMFFSDGKERFSGYHLWFWKGGIKLRRLEEEVSLIKDYRMTPGTSHKLNIEYNKGAINVIIDGTNYLSYTDSDPLHKRSNLKYMGLNIASYRGNVNFSDLMIK